MTTDRLAAMLHQKFFPYAACIAPNDPYCHACHGLAARLAAAGVRFDVTCECGHPDICTPAAGVTVAAQPAKRDHDPDFWADCAAGRCPHLAQPAPDLRAAAQAVVEAWDAHDPLNSVGVRIAALRTALTEPTGGAG